MATRFGLSERIDTNRPGVAGHSFGAYTAMTSVGAKVDLGTLRGKSFADLRNVSLPVLTQTGLGDGDPLTGEARPDRRIPFMKMPAPAKMEAFLNEQRATHNTFNLTSDAPTEFHDWIRATGIAWFDATLQRRDAARAWLASDALVQVSGELQQVSRKAMTPPGG